MPKTFWPLPELREARTDKAQETLDELLAQFEERTRPMRAAFGATQQPAAQPDPWKIDRSGLTPWAEPEAPAAPSASTPVAGLFNRDALMPWKVPEGTRSDAKVPEGTRSGVPDSGTPIRSPGEMAPEIQASAGHMPSSGRGAEGVEQWSPLVSEAARAYNLPEATIKGLMEIESGGNKDAVSAAGAQGLLQVMPFHFAPGENPRDPRTNIMKGAKVYADALRRYGDPDKAAAAYFGAIDANGNITGATDATGTDGHRYVSLWRQAAAKYGGTAPGVNAAPPPAASAVSPPAPPAPAAPTPPPAAGGAERLTVRNKRTGFTSTISRDSWNDTTNKDEFEIVTPQAQTAPAPPDDRMAARRADPRMAMMAGAEPLDMPPGDTGQGVPADPAAERTRGNNQIEYDEQGEEVQPRFTPGPPNRIRYDLAGNERPDNRPGTLMPAPPATPTRDDPYPLSYRQPLGAQPELPADYDPRDADSGPHEAGYTIPDAPTSGGAPVLRPLLSAPAPVPSQADAEEAGRVESQRGAASDERYLDTSIPSPPGWQAIVDGAGQVVDWVRERVSDAATAISENMAGNRRAVEEANAATGTDQNPLTSAIGTVGAGVRGAVDAVPGAVRRAGEAALEGAQETTAAMGPPPVPTDAAGVLAAADWLRRRLDPLAPYNDIVGAAVQAFGDEIGRRVAAAMGVPDTEIANVLGHSITGQDVGGFVGSTMLDPSNYFGAGEVRSTARAAAPAVREGVESAGRRIRGALDANAERVAAADARAAEQGSTSTLATFGQVPSERWRAPSEQELRSEFGTRIQETPDNIRGPESVERVQAARGETPYDNSRVPPNFDQQPLARDDAPRTGGINLNATPGVSPGSSPDVLGAVSREVGSSLGSGVFGAAAGAAAPADTDEERRRNALVGAGLGMVGAPAARRLARSGGGALATPGITPGRPDPNRPLRLRGRPIEMTQAEEVSRLRLDKFPEPLRPHIQQAAESTGFAHDARRGVISDEAAEGAADTITRSVDDWITRSKVGQSLNTEETRALRNLVTGQAQKVDDLAREIADAEAGGVVTDLLIARAHQEGEKLASLVSVMEGARAEAGRTLRAWQSEARPANPTEAAQRIFNKFGGGPEGRQRALDALKEFNQIPVDDPIARANFWARVERGGKITATDVLTAIRYNSMLSSPRTWEVGWIGSVLQAPLKIASDVMAATSRPLSGELGEAAKGAAMGIRAGLRPLWETLAHGITSDQALAGQLPRGLAARATSTPGKAAGTLIDLPGRMVAAPDAFFTSVFTQAEKGRQAAIAAYKQGLKGEARDAFISQFMQNTPKEAQAEVDRIVNGLMLRGDMGRFGRWASGVATKDPLIGSFVAPFMKVSYHIWTQGLDLTPVGTLGTGIDILRGAYRGGKRPEGVKPLAERARMNAIGLGITGAVTWQALHGNVSGAGPDDIEKRDELRATGWQPYSVKIGDRWVSYANWGPVAVPLSLAAAYAENQKYKKSDASAEDQMFDMAKRVTQLVTEQTFLQGIGTIMNAFEDPQRYLPTLLAQQASSLIPYGSALNTVGQSQDDVQRRPDRPADVGLAESLGQSIKGRIPMNPVTPNRGDVPVAQGPLGHPIENQQSGAMAFQPFRISKERDDQTAQIARAYLDVGVDLGRPPSSFTEDGVKIDMTPEQQRAYQRYMGEYIERGFGRANNASDRRRTEMLKSLYEEARASAQARVKSEIGRSDIRQRVRAGSGQR